MPLRARTNLWVRSLKVTRPKRSPWRCGHQGQVQRGVDEAFQDLRRARRGARNRSPRRLPARAPRGTASPRATARRAVAFQWMSSKPSPGTYWRRLSNSRPLPTWRGGARRTARGAQKQRGGGAVAQVGIDADRALERGSSASGPEAPAGRRFEVQVCDRVVAALDAGAGPVEPRVAGAVRRDSPRPDPAAAAALPERRHASLAAR